MNKIIRSYTHLLKSGTIGEDKFNSVLFDCCEISSNTDVVSENRREIAELFYSILYSCNQVYNDTLNKEKDGLPGNVKENIMTFFSNIEHIYLDSTIDEKGNGDVGLVRFLSKIKTMGENPPIDISREDISAENATLLLDVLGNINFLFDFTVNGKVVFPIHKIIALVIDKNSFINTKKKLDKKDIKLLQLAVRLFQSSPEEESVFKKLKKDCNLKFIEYLENDSQIIDTRDLLNFQYNGVIIIYNGNTGEVLVRSDNKDYFCLPTKEYIEPNAEYDYEGNTHSWFVEYKLEESKLTSYKEQLLKTDTSEKVLRLLFDDGIKNIFFDDAIYVDNNGKIGAVNRYSINDEYNIKGDRTHKGEATHKARGLSCLLNEYRLCAIKSSNMNRLTVGLCVLLLEINNLGVDSLGLNEFSEDQWYQEQLINRWINHPYTREDSLLKMLEQWYKQLDYCATEKGLENHRLKATDFLPLRQSLEDIINVVVEDRYQEEGLLEGTVVRTEEENSFVIEVSLRSTSYGKHLKEHGIKSLEVYNDELEDLTKEFKWETNVNLPLYFMYSAENHKGHIANQALLKAVVGLEAVMQNTMDFSVGKAVGQRKMKLVYDGMRMYKTAFNDFEREKKTVPQNGFETQYYMRLLHNMIWSEITLETIEPYFNIIGAHQIVSFEDIKGDPIFLCNNPNTLYLTRDRVDNGSVLTNVYYYYIDNDAYRDQHPLYARKLLHEKDGEYTFNGQPIKRIVLLTDNYVNGSSTIATLAAYMKQEKNPEGFEWVEGKKKKVLEAIEPIEYEREEISILDIIKKNDATLCVHAYYGTDKGKTRILEYISACGICSSEVGFFRDLTSNDSAAIEQAHKLWNNKYGDSNEGEELRKYARKENRPERYLFFREFSMPKFTVFPPQMLSKREGDIDKAICMYVKRDELDWG